MQILIRLFLRRFRKRRYIISLIIWAALHGLLWLLRGIAEEIIFNRIVSHIGISGGDVVVILGLTLGLGILAILIWMYIDTKREFTSQHLQNTLKEMHKRLRHLTDIQLSKKHPRKEELKEKIKIMAPVLMHKLELVDLDRWDNFKDSIAIQLKRPITEQSKRKGTWHYKVSGVAARIKKDLLDSKNWTMAGIDIIIEWFDSQTWALKEIREKDKQWNSLYETIEPFTRDGKLRELISKHISISYGSCNALLVAHYSAKWPTSIPIAVLHETLVGSPLNPVKIDLALSEILGDIDKRMNTLKRKQVRATASE